MRAKELIFKWRHMQLYQMRMMLIFANDLLRNMAWLLYYFYFYADGKDLKLIRFCFAKDNATLEEAAKRLCAI
jgi:hypothetical protein